METFDLTPAPQLLQILGDLNFKGWQCIAELIDNSIDAIVNGTGLAKEQKIINVMVPTPSKIKLNEPLVVEDFATGMTAAQLENSVRAGFTSKNTRGNIGLFGMGFNVATSRLANSVEVWTSTTEMDHEIGVRIDLKEMAQSKSFIRPKLTRPKKAGKISGTEIKIFDFKATADSLLKIRDIVDSLNRAYTERIFKDVGVRIFVNNQEIKPFKFCHWSEDITVKVKYEDIPAYEEINELLKDELFCENCFSWIGATVDTSIKIECPNCKSVDRIVKKDIYLSGWVGIQRYPDPDHYGIDISRNGRILKKLDKTMFFWQDDRVKEDTRFNPEYPRDTPQSNGRIVGQIEANFLMPKYTKDDFDTDDKNWKQAVKFLRGEMPLQTDLGESLFGFRGVNRSPIGKLFRAYRRISPPGSKTLIFAKVDGSADYVTQRAWAHKFYAGDTEFQDEKKWWENISRSELKEPETPYIDPLNPFGNKPPKVNSTGLVITPVTEKFPGKKILKKTLRFDLEKIIGEKPYQLTLIDYYPDTEINMPIIFDPQGMGKFQVYLNNNHPMFRDFADGYEDLIYMEVAAKYASLKRPEEWPVTKVYYELKSRYAPETMLSVPNLISKANNLLRDIQNRLVKGEGIQLSKAPSLSDQDKKDLVKGYLDLEGKKLNNFEAFILNTKFLKYLELNYIFKFIEEFPEFIFDGNVFVLPYSELDQDNKQYQLKKYLGYFHDVGWFINDLSKQGDDAIKKLKQLIIRNRYSIEILYGSFNK